MAIYDGIAPTADWCTYVPKRLDGSGVIGFHAQLATIRYFKLDTFPSPEDHGVPNPSGKGRLIAWPSSKRGANNGSFRIAYEAVPGRQKPRMARFRLSGGHVMETLQVITNMLNSTDVPWLYLANAHGNPISRSAFRSTALFGKRGA